MARFSSLDCFIAIGIWTYAASINLEARECQELREVGTLIQFAQTSESLSPSTAITRRLKEFDLDRHEKWSAYGEVLARIDPEGIPRFKDRPERKGFTGFVVAFARNRAGDLLMAERIKKLASAVSKRFWEVNTKLEGSVDLATLLSLQREQTDLGTEVQYYNEMRAFIDGTSLPYFGQTETEVDRFIAVHPKSISSQTEALYRIHFLEKRLIEETNRFRTAAAAEKGNNQKQLAKTFNELKFYRNLLSRIDRSIADSEN